MNQDVDNREDTGSIVAIGLNKEGARAVVETFERVGVTLVLVDDLKQARRQLRTQTHYVVLVNLTNEDLSVQALQDLHRRFPYIQILALIPQGATTKAVEAVRYGAYDYLTFPLPNTSVVGRVIERAIDKARLTQQNQVLTEQVRQTTQGLDNITNKLDRLATVDDLTYLYNHRHFHEMLVMEVSRSERYGRTFSVVLIDIDGFQRYTKSHGHKAGELLVYSFAQLLKDNIRISDLLARYGNDEFATLLPETTVEGAQEFVQRLTKKFLEHTFPGQEAFPRGSVTFSAGIATFPFDGHDGTTLLERAADTLQQVVFPDDPQ